METSLIEFMTKGLDLPQMDPKAYSPLGLAYIGDAVYEIAVRTLVISEGNMSVNKYHKKSSSLVKASAQAGVYDNIKKSSQTKRQPSISGAEMPNLLRPQKMLRSWNTGWPQGSKP